MNSYPLIELEQVSVRRTETDEVLMENINWRIEAGDWWVLAGEHGSGKSLLLQCLAGLIPLGAGTLTVFGERFIPESRQTPGWQQRIGLMFEGGGRMLRELTVAENIALPIAYHRNCPAPTALEDVLPLIQALELERFAKVSAGRIGHAWTQRVALGRALALGPELLLLDNPLADMDQNHLRWWRRFLPQLVAGHPSLGGRPLTLVVTTGNLRPWLAPGRQFGVVQNRQLRILGDQTQITQQSEDELHDWFQPD